jgi:N utilization substance protein B
MLNRRILRIKAMQALYSLELSKESLVGVIEEELLHDYALDPAVHDFNDKPVFAARQKEISRVFQIKLDKTGDVTPETDLDSDIINNIDNAIETYTRQVEGEQRRIKRLMLDEADEIFNTYLKLLLIPGELAFIVRKELDNEKKSPYLNLYKHLEKSDIIQSLSTNADLVDQSISKKVSWKGEEDVLARWFKEIIRKDPQINEIYDSAVPNEHPHLDFLLYFYKQIVFKQETVEGFFIERDLHWSENKSILKSLILKTIKSYDPNTNQLELKTLSVNKEEDFDFFKKLFKQTVSRDEELEKIIEKKAKNWDISRIAKLDMIILKMALVEMLIFPSIPVKVTINEFIEISKLYSTPKSKQFINGILDVLANELTSDGVVKKSGRGLMDNK